jgi:hypothetical protein
MKKLKSSIHCNGYKKKRKIGIKNVQFQRFAEAHIISLETAAVTTVSLRGFLYKARIVIFIGSPYERPLLLRN